MADMEALRIEEELKKQKFLQNPTNFNRYSKDSGVVDVEMSKMADAVAHRLSAPECERMKKTTLSSSLIDIGDGKLIASLCLLLSFISIFYLPRRWCNKNSS